jgi:hypothetical protein
MEVGVIFTPIPNYSFSRILGVGWSLPVLESTLLPFNDREYEMILPTGYRKRLERTKTPNQLEGAGWIATINGRDIIAKSSSGDELRYQAGRLKIWKTSDGVTVEFHRNEQGAYWITAANGQTLLSLKPTYDATTTQKIYHLHLQGGKHAVLRYGVRPTLVKTAEKDSFGNPKERTQNMETLVSVQWDGEPERKYGFDLNSLNVAGEIFKWNNGSLKLIQKGNEKFEFISIQGISCLKTLFPDGSSTVFGSSHDGKQVQQSRYGNIEISEHFSQGIAQGKPRKILQIDEHGNEIFSKVFSYDENGKNIRTKMKSQKEEIIYENKGNVEIAKKAGTGELIFEKSYDKTGRLISLKTKQGSYRFSYPENTNNVLVQTTRDSTVVEKTITLETFTSMTQGF